MSANKWTPGPWETEIAEYGSRRIGTVFCGGKTIAQICGLGAGPRSGPTAGFGALTATTDANARLIKAAPDLAKALAELIEEYDPNMKAFAYNAPRKAKWERARAALAKARGES